MLFIPTYKPSQCLFKPTFITYPSLYKHNQVNAFDIREPNEIPIEEVWAASNLRITFNSEQAQRKKNSMMLFWDRGASIFVKCVFFLTIVVLEKSIKLWFIQSWRATRERKIYDV